MLFWLLLCVAPGKRGKKSPGNLNNAEERELKDALELLHALDAKKKKEHAKDEVLFDHEVLSIEESHAQLPIRVKIRTVGPIRVSLHGGVPIFLDTSPRVRSAPVFCQFGSAQVVFGTILDNGTVICVAPPHTPGTVNLAVSTDRSNWSDPVEVEFVDTENWAMPIVIVCACVVLLGVPVFFLLNALKTVCCRKRKQFDDQIASLTVALPELNEPQKRTSSRMRRNVI